MKTSMAYRLYRLYFNSNADNHELFGNRVHNPLNKSNLDQNQTSAAVTRMGLILISVLGILALIALNA